MDTSNNERTVRAIEHAFWGIFMNKPIELISVREVADKANLPVSTVTSIFPTCKSILRRIEDNQLAELDELFNSYDWRGLDFNNLYDHYQKYFYENEEILFPLVMDRRDPDFANEYRAILEDRLFRDLNIYTTKKNPRAPEMVEYLIECFIEMFLVGIAHHKFGKEEVTALTNGLMREGFEKMLRDDFGVVFKIIYRTDYRHPRSGWVYLLDERFIHHVGRRREDRGTHPQIQRLPHLEGT
jgi:AcrR family transcriptional regulator